MTAGGRDVGVVALAILGVVVRRPVVDRHGGSRRRGRCSWRRWCCWPSVRQARRRLLGLRGNQGDFVHDASIDVPPTRTTGPIGPGCGSQSAPVSLCCRPMPRGMPTRTWSPRARLKPAVHDVQCDVIHISGETRVTIIPRISKPSACHSLRRPRCWTRRRR